MEVNEMDFRTPQMLSRRVGRASFPKVTYWATCAVVKMGGSAD